jgi:hypothetical protein
MGLGDLAGGYFEDTSGESGSANVGFGDRGIWGQGDFAGGTFTHTDGITMWADVGHQREEPPGSGNWNIYKIRGNGSVSFVQNHPQDPDKVIVYAAPEGDENAVYTRGTARLVAGQARVPLGETFQWVANPDLGLTTYLTPHGDCLGLYVESLTSEELVVRELGGGTSDILFDYLVFGLRAGFERAAVVQTKDREGLPPESSLGDAFYTSPDLPDAYTALERFRRMEAEARDVSPDQLDLGHATALRAAIRASAWQQLGKTDPAAMRGPIPGRDRVPAEDRDAAPRTDGSTAETASTTALGGTAFEDEDPAHDLDPLTRFPVSGPVEAGDLLVFDPKLPGVLVRGASAHDPGVVGIVAGEPVTVDGALQVALVETNYAVLHVDAGYGAIRPGDLLTSSFTPGRAMRAIEMIPGTIVGKALEPLEAGTGSIRVLVMPR